MDSRTNKKISERKFKLKKRQLGKNGPEITEIGLGAWAIGGPWAHGWGPQNDHDSIKAIEESIKNGINWIDTAAVYGLGHSEKIIGKTIKHRRDKIFLASKCGLRWDNSGNIKRDSSPKSIRYEIEASLRRLNTEYIDLYQIHWPDTKTPIQKSWEEMTRLKEEGKVRYIGVSNYNLIQLKKALEISPIQSLQSPYSLVNRYLEKDIFPFLKEKEIGFLAYSPMQAGLLTGKFTKEKIQNLPEDDWRKKNPFFNDPLFTKINDLLIDLTPISKTLNMTLSQLSLRWVLDNQETVTSSIAGARNKEQATINAQAVSSISQEILEKIEHLYKNNLKGHLLED